MQEQAEPQETPREDVVYVVREEEKSNSSWIFWLIVIGVLIFGVIYIANTIEDATDPFKWFEVVNRW